MSTSEPQRGWLGRSAGFWHVLACLALALLTAGTFLNVLENEFVSFDDWFLIEQNPHIRSLSWANVAHVFGTRNRLGVWLPLRVLSYAVDYHFWGLDAFGYHLTNLGLHVANALLVYAVLHWLLKRPGLALLGAAWFAVHPAQVESVAWASGRRDVLYGFFFLLTFAAFVAYERRRGWMRWVLYGASLVFLACSLLSKGMGMMLPAVLVMTVLLFEGAGEGLWRRLALCVPHGVVAAAGAAAHYLGAQGAGIVKGRPFGMRLPSVPWVFAEYWRLLLFPVNLSTPRPRSPIQWSETWLIAGSIALVAGVVLVVWWVSPRRVLAWFCLGWWFLLLLPVSNVVPLSMLLAERYLYLPLVGACGFGAALVGSLTGRRRAVGMACAVAVVALCAVATHHRNRVWRDSLVFWQDNVSKWPDASNSRCGLAITYVEANALELAWRQYMEVALAMGSAAAQTTEQRDLALAGLRRCYARVARQREAEGRRDAARNAYEMAVRLMPNELGPRVSLAQAYERYGMAAKAREQVLAVRKLDPDYPGLDEWLQRLEGPPPRPAPPGPQE